MRVRRQRWIVLALVAVIAAVFVGVALAEGGTTGDISYSAIWKGSGTQTTLHVKNTAGAGGHTISDFTFQIGGSGAQIAQVTGGGCSTQAFGGGQLPAGEIQCGNALDPGHAELIAIMTTGPVAAGTSGTLVFSDDGEQPQPGVTVKLHGKKSKHHKKPKHKKKHKKKHHHK
jgi:hypothetical protein